MNSSLRIAASSRPKRPFAWFPVLNSAIASWPDREKQFRKSLSDDSWDLFTETAHAEVELARSRHIGTDRFLNARLDDLLQPRWYRGGPVFDEGALPCSQ